MLIIDATLEQDLLKLFNNAADAGSDVNVVAAWDEQWLTVDVRDSGPGFVWPVLEQAGRVSFPTHDGGSGIGCRGRMQCTDRPNQGAAQVTKSRRA